MGQAVAKSSAYERVVSMIASERCVQLDGATGTELPQVASAQQSLHEPLWGTRALIDTPDVVLDVHRRYAEIACDVISTNTWGLAAMLAADNHRLLDDAGAPVHWMDIARRGLRLAREAVVAADRDDACAVAFSLNGDVDSPRGRETIGLLARLFADEIRPPDLILVETLSVLRPSLDETVEELLGTGLPVWLSFRRCRHGPCGVYGQHWGGPEGDAFGRAARPCRRDGVLPARLHGPPAGRVSEPGVLHGPGLALRSGCERR
jgi:Homocysteine S-methyltransferase